MDLGKLYKNQIKTQEQAKETYIKKIQEIASEVLKNLEDKGLTIGETFDVCETIKQTCHMQFYKRPLVDVKE